MAILTLNIVSVLKCIFFFHEYIEFNISLRTSREPPVSSKPNKDLFLFLISCLQMVISI